MLKFPKRKGLAWILAALTLSGILIPVSYSGHINDLLQLPRLGGSGLDQTGISPFDAAIQQAASLADPAVDQFNEARPWKDEPQLPATFFHDSLDGGTRVGGWGSYDTSFVGAGRDAWKKTTPAPGDGAYRFWDPATGWYPTSPTAQLDAYLITPRISLVSLPVELEQVHSCADQSQCPGAVRNNVPATADFTAVSNTGQLILTLQDRFNIGSNDLAAVRVFLDEPPTAETLGMTQVPRAFSAVPAVNAPGNPFSGASGGAFTTRSFVLDPFAGHDVWLAFHVSVDPVSDRTRYFTDPAQFMSTMNYGWEIASIDIEGPAYAHNVRIDELLGPAQCGAIEAGEVSCEFPSGDDQEGLRLLAVNHGQFTEEVTPSLSLRRAADGADLGCSPLEATETLVPGGLKEIEFECQQNPASGQSYTAAFRLDLPTGQPDLYPTDNALEARIDARRDLRIVLEPPLMSPLTGTENDPRDLSITVRNDGIGREAVTVALTILNETGVDVTHTSAVEFISGGGALVTRTFALDPDARQESAWRFVLVTPGIYTMWFRVRVADQQVGEAKISASTLLSQPLLYDGGFDQGAPGWTVERWRDQKPPNFNPLQQNTQYVLEVGRVVPAASKTVSLRLYPDPNDAADTPAFDELEVRILRYLEFRCKDAYIDSESGDWRDCNVNQTNPRAGLEIKLDLDVGNKQPKTNLPVVPVAGGNSVNVDGTISQTFSTVALPLHKTWFARTEESYPGNQAGYYSGQWVEETYRIKKEEVAADLDSFPTAFAIVVTVIRTEATCASTSGHPGTTGISPQNLNCPPVRIARASAVGITASGERLPRPLIHFNGGVVGEFEETGIIEDNTCPGPYANKDVSQSNANFGPLGTGCTSTSRFFRTLTKDILTPMPAGTIQTWALRDLAQMVGGTGVWTTSSASLRYSDGAIDSLISPPITVSPSAANPILQFQHKFLFQSLPFFPDHGMVLVRQLDPISQTAVTPFMPIALNLTEDGKALDPARLQQRFAGSDCDHYGLHHPNAEGAVPCNEVMLKDRRMITHSLPLADLPVLNYSRVNDLLRMASPPAGPDAPALERLDLRGQTVQFAFRFVSIEPMRAGFSTTKATAHAAATGGEGWYIGDFRIRADSRLGHDVKVTHVDLTASYDWVAKGLGPGTDGTLHVKVQNNGRFEERKFRFVVQVHDVASGEVTSEEIVDPPGFVLVPGQEDTLDIPFTAPDEAGAYRILVSVLLHGDLKAGTPLVDEGPEDNCAALDGQGLATLGICNLAAAPVIPVIPRPALQARLTVTPMAGRADFAREVNIAVTNAGNVVVEDAELSLIVQNIDKKTTQPAQTWTMFDSPPPGSSQPWDSLNLSRAPSPLLTLNDVGQFLLTVRLEAEGVSTADQLLLASFENFYSDRFEPGTFDGSPFLTGKLDPDDPAWGTVTGLSYQEGSESWHFGDLVHGRYPESTTANLEFPHLDFSTAAKIRVSFAHRYGFERRYDGGRLEASLDDGATWQTVPPIGGYPTTLLPRTLDETAATNGARPGGFSGDSRGVAPASDGWVVSEFDLAVIRELTTNVAVQRFDQERFVLDRVNTHPAAEPRISFDSSWAVPGGTCRTGCWYRDNLNAGSYPTRNPAGLPDTDPLSADPLYWWSGSPGAQVPSAQNSRNSINTVLPLDIDLRAVSATNKLPELSFWAWKDRAGEMVVSVVDGSAATVVPLRTVTLRDDNWTEYALDLTSFAGRDISIRFRYKETLFENAVIHSASNLGLVIDDVALRVYDRSAGSLALDPLHSRSFPSSSLAWRPPIIVDQFVDTPKAGTFFRPGDANTGVLTVLPAGAGQFAGVGFRDLDASGLYSPADAVYLVRSATAVGVGDVRLTSVGDLPGGSRVRPGDADAGAAATVAGARYAYVDRDASGTLNSADTLFLQFDAATAVTAGAVRLTSSPHATPFSRVGSTDPDLGAALVANSVQPRAESYQEIDGVTGFTAGDFVFLDQDLSATVTAGDVRVSIVAVRPAGATVASDSQDRGGSMQDLFGTDDEFQCVCHDDLDNDNTLDANEPIFLQKFGTTSAGDLRLVPNGAYPGGTRILAGDADLGVTTRMVPAVYRYIDADASTTWTVSDTMYLSFRTFTPLRVDVGDIRLTSRGGLPAFTRVANTDADFNAVSRNSGVLLFDESFSDTDASGGLSAADALYLDMDQTTPGVSTGDVRLTAVSASQAWCRAGSSCLFGWSKRSTIPTTPEAWNLTTHESRMGDLRKVWWFGDRPLVGGQYSPSNYPINAKERLVTPVISLTGIGGTVATLQYWEHFDMAGNDPRTVWVKIVDPLLNVEQPWTLLHASSRGGRSTSLTNAACVPTRAWCSVEIPISSYIGHDIVIAFQANTTRFNPNIVAGSEGYHWAIDGVEVRADSLVGQPLRLRLNATTDRSISGEGWSIDNLQVVGLVFQRNIALLPDQAEESLSVAPGGTLDLTGAVRNLGARREANSHLAVRVEGVKEIGLPVPPPPTLVEAVLPDQSTAPMPLLYTLGPAGLKNTQGDHVDRAPYHARIVFPSAVTDVSYRVTLFMVDDPADTVALDDDSLGDHERTFDVRIEDVREVTYADPVITPPTTTTGQPVNIRFTVGNLGTVAQAVSASFKVLNVDTGQVAQESPAFARNLGIGTSTVLDWSWPAGATGFYKVLASVGYDGPTGARVDEPLVGYILVNRLPIYYRTNFEDNAADWSSASAGAHSTCGQGSSDGASTPWRLVDGLGFDGGRAFYAGVILGEDAGTTYAPRQDTILNAPSVDLRALADLAQTQLSLQGYVPPKSPFEPALTFRYQSILGQNDGVLLQARRAADPSPTALLGPYPGVVTCGNPLADPAVLPNPNGAPRDAITGSDENWFVAEFPLGGGVTKNGANQDEPILGHVVDFSWRFGSDTIEESLGFALDTVSVSSYSARIEPAEEHVGLGSGADKTYHFVVTNTGAAADTFQVRLNPAFSRFPAFYDVSVSPEEVELEAGESAAVTIGIRVSDNPLLQPSANDILVLEAVSQADPNRIGTARLIVDQFAPTPLADLALTLQPAGGALGTILEGDRISMLATVRNIGRRATFETDLVVMACRATSAGLAVDLANCNEAEPALADDPCGPGTDLIAIALVSVPPLPSPEDATSTRASFATFPIRWTTRLGCSGAFHIVGVVDPLAYVHQTNLANDLATFDANVLPLQAPDVRAFGLVVLDAAGTPVHMAVEGQPLTIQGSFTNSGTADAENVVLTLANQFVLRQDLLGTMPPGRTVDFATTWIAKAGNYLVMLQAGTTTPEFNELNNAQNWPLAVRPGAVNVTLDPLVVHLTAGGSEEVRLRIHNGRSTPAETVLEAKAPEGLSVLGLPGEVSLQRGAEYETDLVFEASPFLARSTRGFAVNVRDKVTNELLGTASVSVFVDSLRFVRYATQDLVMPPGSGKTNLTVSNAGEAPEAIRLRADAPAGWGVVLVPSTLVVPAGASGSIQVHVQAPEGQPPGTYPIALATLSGEQVGQILVQITSSPRWDVQVDAVREFVDGLEAWVRVRNIGNAPGVPDDPSLGELAGAAVSIEPPLGPLLSGQSEVYHLRVSGNGAAGPQAMLRFAGAASIPLRTPQALLPKLEMSSWQVLPLQGVEEGETVRIKLTLRNAGTDVARDVPVRAYVDGRLVEEQLVEVAAGASRSVELQWRARPGEHVVTVTAGADATVARATALSVSPDVATAPGASVGLFLCFLLVVFWTRRRRGAA